MRIIIDSNVLFSALIKDSLTRKIILEYEDKFLFPDFIFEEMEEHKDELREKCGLDDASFDALLSLILDKVRIVPNDSLLPFRDRALDLVKDIDRDDAIFVACALAYDGSYIWSDDRKLKTVKNVRVLNTKEIIDILNMP